MSLQVVRVDVVGQRAALQRGQRQHGGARRQPRQLARARQHLARFVPVLQFTVLCCTRIYRYKAVRGEQCDS